MMQNAIWALTGREGYEYDLLCDLADDELTSYCGSVRNQFAAQAKAWSNDRNTTWIARHYLAVKYILAAQLKASATAYARVANLLIVIPYLQYYTLFHACRAF